MSLIRGILGPIAVSAAFLLVLMPAKPGSVVALDKHAEPVLAERQRRVLYNLDGSSCMFTRAGSQGPVKLTVDDLKGLVDEITFEGSQVDTILVCVNAQVMFYPTRVGTMRGSLATAEERRQWPASERQWFENVKGFFAAGVDPYAVILAEARRKGIEALLSFRMNDAHEPDFLRARFWIDHPEYRTGYHDKGLDFGAEAVRDYTFALIDEAVQRYDCDGVELDFQRFPTFFKDGTSEERIAKINEMVSRVRVMLDQEGEKRDRRLILSARVPSDYGRTPPSHEKSLEIGCDPAAWARNGWVDFLVVSDFLHHRFDLSIAPWKQLIREVPIYAGIERHGLSGGQAKPLTADEYRMAAARLQAEGTDGIYLFNFFTTREKGADATEPPFELLRELANPSKLPRKSSALEQ